MILPLVGLQFSFEKDSITRHLPRKMSLSIFKTLSSGERGLLSTFLEDSHRLGLDWLIRSLFILDTLLLSEKQQQQKQFWCL